MENGEETQTPASYGKRPLWQWILLYAVVAVIVYGLFYYFVLAKNTTNPYQSGTSQNNAAVTIIPTETPTQAMTEENITIEGNEFAFTPSAITLKKGQATKITFKNIGKFPHDLSIDGLDVSTKVIKPGEEDTITITPEKAGSYTFTCTVGNHADEGMTGTLTVE